MAKKWIMTILYLASLTTIWLGFADKLEGNQDIYILLVGIIIGVFLGMSSLELSISMIISALIGVVVAVFNESGAWMIGLSCLASSIFFYLIQVTGRRKNIVHLRSVPGGKRSDSQRSA